LEIWRTRSVHWRRIRGFVVVFADAVADYAKYIEIPERDLVVTTDGKPYVDETTDDGRLHRYQKLVAFSKKFRSAKNPCGGEKIFCEAGGSQGAQAFNRLEHALDRVFSHAGRRTRVEIRCGPRIFSALPNVSREAAMAPDSMPQGTSTRTLDTREQVQRWLAEMRPRLHRYCARMVGSVVAGEDVVQDALLKAVGASEQLGSIERPEAWLFQIAHNAAYDALRRRARELAVAGPEELERLEDVHAHAEDRVMVAASVQTFMQLSPPQRAAVVLKDVLGYRLDEICGITGSTLPVVKAALHRGRARLRELAAEPVVPAARPTMTAGQRSLLEAYVDRFNARDFDAIRSMLAHDIEVDLVNDKVLRGPRTQGYFERYAGSSGWRVEAGYVDGTPAVLFRRADPAGSVASSSDHATAPAITHFVIVNGDATARGIVAIRDYRYATYVLDGAEIAAAEPAEPAAVAGVIET
jgi:RNA polymerase sigma-70 factor (ECF subfamily)